METVSREERGESRRVHVAGAVDRVLKPVHRWVWSNPRRRSSKLLRFAQTEADGGRDIARAAECTEDALLRRLYLRHALDEQRHARLFRTRGCALWASLQKSERRGFEADWLTPGERGLDDLDVDTETDASLLAFLHLSEKAATRRFAVYQEVLDTDPATRDVFTDVLRDEAFHMNYTYAQLKRVSPRRHGLRLWRARLSRLWKGYLRVATALASLLGGVMLTIQYFVFLPLFALLAKRAETRERLGWRDVRAAVPGSFRSQY